VQKSALLTIALVVTAVGTSIVPLAASANISYTPWVHELNQVGQDVEVTVQVFDESDAMLGPEGEQIPVPDLSSAYTLTRVGIDVSKTLLEDQVFSPKDAFEVIEYGCVPRNIWFSGDCPGDWNCEDCDDDGEAECDGFCAVTYRFSVVDDCAAPGDAMYYMRTDYAGPAWYEDEGLGFTNTVVEDTGDPCLDDDSGCSVSGVGRDAGVGAVTGAILMLVGIFAMARSRRRG
jgi:hypothetical protein